MEIILQVHKPILFKTWYLYFKLFINKTFARTMLLFYLFLHSCVSTAHINMKNFFTYTHFLISVNSMFMSVENYIEYFCNSLYVF